ncbi:hypothetical protein [Rhizobium mayense]|uniref:hypothetical protein n=1 Tax=Rhizobium mayense TaxID=1312184 RepID=UPI00398C26FB
MSVPKFAVVSVDLVAQGLRMSDGTNLIVQLDAPQAVFAVMRKGDDFIEVTSLHHNEEEALEHMAIAELAEGGGTLQ